MEGLPTRLLSELECISKVTGRGHAAEERFFFLCGGVKLVYVTNALMKDKSS